MSVWNAYWRDWPIEAPSSQPAYVFVMKMIRKAFGKTDGIKVVELGAGRGEISFMLAKAGADVTLIDSSKIALEQARMIFAQGDLQGEFVLADLFESEIRGSFDVVMSFGLIEHYVGQQRKRLFEMHGSGRIAFVSVPNALCVPYRLWKFAKEAANDWPYGLERPFMKGELRRDMEAQFKHVCIFATPLSYNLGRGLGLDVSLRLPLDSRFGYQLVACGRG